MQTQIHAGADPLALVVSLASIFAVGFWQFAIPAALSAIGAIKGSRDKNTAARQQHDADEQKREEETRERNRSRAYKSSIMQGLLRAYGMGGAGPLATSFFGEGGGGGAPGGGGPGAGIPGGLASAFGAFGRPDEFQKTKFRGTGFLGDLASGFAGGLLDAYKTAGGNEPEGSYGGGGNVGIPGQGFDPFARR